MSCEMRSFKGPMPQLDGSDEVMHGDFYKRNLGDQIWDDVIDRMKFIDPSVKIFFNDHQLLTSDYGQENLKVCLVSEKTAQVRIRTSDV